MVYDRETGAMRTLLVSPFPRWYLLSCKLMASVIVGVLQVYAFLLIAYLWGVEPPLWGYLAALPALIASGLLLGAIGLLISSVIKQLENFAGVMNFVIFPMFFASSALFPLWYIREGSVELWYIASWNPFTHCVELIRFALYLQVNWFALGIVAGGTAPGPWRCDPRLRPGPRHDGEKGPRMRTPVFQSKGQGESRLRSTPEGRLAFTRLGLCDTLDHGRPCRPFSKQSLQHLIGAYADRV